MQLSHAKRCALPASFAIKPPDDPFDRQYNAVQLNGHVLLRIDTSRVWDGENDHVASWAIRNLAEDEIRAEQGQSNWRCLITAFGRKTGGQSRVPMSFSATCAVREELWSRSDLYSEGRWVRTEVRWRRHSLLAHL